LAGGATQQPAEIRKRDSSATNLANFRQPDLLAIHDLRSAPFRSLVVVETYHRHAAVSARAPSRSDRATA